MLRSSKWLYSFRSPTKTLVDVGLQILCISFYPNARYCKTVHSFIYLTARHSLQYLVAYCKAESIVSCRLLQDGLQFRAAYCKVQPAVSCGWLKSSPQYPVPYCKVQSTFWVITFSSSHSLKESATACTEFWLMENSCVPSPMVEVPFSKPEWKQKQFLFPSFYMTEN